MYEIVLSKLNAIIPKTKKIGVIATMILDKIINCLLTLKLEIKGIMAEGVEIIKIFVINIIIPAVWLHTAYNSADNSLPRIGTIKKLKILSIEIDAPYMMFGDKRLLKYLITFFIIKQILRIKF